MGQNCLEHAFWSIFFYLRGWYPLNPKIWGVSLLRQSWRAPQSFPVPIFTTSVTFLDITARGIARTLKIGCALAGFLPAGGYDAPGLSLGSASRDVLRLLARSARALLPFLVVFSGTSLCHVSSGSLRRQPESDASSVCLYAAGGQSFGFRRRDEFPLVWRFRCCPTARCSSRCTPR